MLSGIEGKVFVLLAAVEGLLFIMSSDLKGSGKIDELDLFRLIDDGYIEYAAECGGCGGGGGCAGVGDGI